LRAGECSPEDGGGNLSLIKRPAWIPWWRIATAVLLSAALGDISMAGRVIEAIIVGVLLIPSIALVGLWLVAWQRDQLECE